jgi:hypothetical protein
MCYNNDPIRGGLVFPSELERDYYAPGVFVIPKIKYNNFNGSYRFTAFDDNEVIELELIRTNKSYEYIVTDKKNRTYRFRIIYWSRYNYTYVGSQIQFPENTLFFFLIPLDHELLNEVCSPQGFYFLGMTKESELKENIKK